MPLSLRLLEVAFARTPCQTRLPFRFGAVTVTAADLLHCRVRCQGGDGSAATGFAGDLLVPRWFRKDTVATPQEDADELAASALAAARAFGARLSRADGVFAAWRDVYQERVLATPDGAPDRLVRGFGTALVERALLDAASRLAGLPFAAALRADVFGFVPGDVHGGLAGWDWQAALPTPQPTIASRHTVGMLDVLRTRDLPAAARVADGLPQTLEEDLATYGHQWLKVKVGAGVAADRARLLDLAAFLAERDLAPGLTLDGNEQYADLDTLHELLATVAEERLGRALLARLACIEQPLPRAKTGDANRHRALAAVTRFAPLLLDEADDSPASVRQAFALGYQGVSVKNCKGVFRALANFGLCTREAGRFLSSEDLTNLAGLPLQQDLVTAAVLGLPHSERNGHHYFRGLDHLPPALAGAALAAHGDLYQPHDGGAALAIRAGRIDFGSALAAVGYGHHLADLPLPWMPGVGS